MRIWHLPLSYLDTQRITAQHYEAHAVATLLLRGRNWGGMKVFANCVNYVRDVHDRCLIELHQRGRGHTHNSPFPELPPERCAAQFQLTLELIVKDITQLREKWEREGYYFGCGRHDLRELEKAYGLAVGRDVESALAIQVETRKLINEHRDVFRKLTGRIQDKLAQWKTLPFTDAQNYDRIVLSTVGDNSPANAQRRASMATVTLTRRRTAKNGIVSYKETPKRTSGTVYLDKKMFVGEPPETIVLEGENIAFAQPEAPAQPAPAESAA